MSRSISVLIVLATAMLLVGCTKPTAQPESSYRIMQRTEIPLQPMVQPPEGQPFRRSFDQRDNEGWISDDGRWSVTGVVDHTHFRCGTYEVGIQLGRGVSACAQPEWFNEPQYGTRERQCNSASLIHTGGATLPVSREQVIAANCVRVLVRCSGTCG